MRSYIFNLTAAQALQAEKSGGKGIGLARLHRMGMKVPPGFIVSAAAFRDFVQKNPGFLESQNTENIYQACEINFPGKLEAQIRKSYENIGGAVAVRSSMVGEDGLLNSFAGQLDSFLNLTSVEDVVHTVKKCYCSVLNQRLSAYVNEREGNLKISLAVIVQQMVAAKAGGVAFSADPRTGQCCVIIEAASGLGDQVAAGKMTPERYIIDNRGVLAESQILNSDQPVLPENAVLRLAEFVRNIALEMQTPQDIEWAWDGEEFHFLQTRPITSLIGKHVYSNKMVSDMSPGLIKPLLWSTNTLAMTQNVFKRIFTELIGQNEIDFRQLLRCIHSRIYADMTFFGELFEQVGLPHNFFEVIVREEKARYRPKINWRLVRSFFRAIIFVWRYSRISEELTAFVRLHNQQLEEFRQANWSLENSGTLLRQLENLLQLHGETQWYVFINALNMAIRNRILNKMVERHAPEAVASDLVRGLSGLKALEPNRMILEMSELAKKLDESTLAKLPQTDVEQLLKKDATGKNLLEQVKLFMRRFGFLSANGTDFSGTPWIENPALIWNAIVLAVKNPRKIDSTDNQKIRMETRQQVVKTLNLPKRKVFIRLLDATIKYIQLREEVSLLMSEDSYQLRRLFLALTARFLHAELIQDKNDIFYLFYDEIRLVVQGELTAGEIKQRISQRREEIQRDAEIEPEETLCDENLAPQTEISLETPPFLVGIGGSSGVVDGFARIIRDPADAPGNIDSNDILIVPFTDVGWTPLFPGIRGIVAETGGLLSHTSIIAREYNLPAVVSVKNATQLIQNGQPITIDGRSGKIYLKHLNQKEGA